MRLVIGNANISFVVSLQVSLILIDFGRRNKY